MEITWKRLGTLDRIRSMHVVDYLDFCNMSVVLWVLGNVSFRRKTTCAAPLNLH